jgi:hypothetical protein
MGGDPFRPAIGIVSAKLSCVTIPMTPRAAAYLEMRRAVANTEWVFPAATRSGHIEKSSLKKAHARACKLANIEDFMIYTFLPDAVGGLHGPIHLGVPGGT